MILTSLWLKHAQGPYWFSPNLDPEYAYLLNSLRLAQFANPCHVDHPGSTLQILGAALIRVTNLFSAMEMGPLVDEVLKNPEYYLNLIWGAEVALYAISLLVGGFIVKRATRSLEAAILVQTTPFLSLTILGDMTRVSPDALLPTFSVVYGIAVFLLICASLNQSDRSWFPLLFGALTGLSLATKITAAPLFLIPLIMLSGWPERLLYMFALAICFSLATFPLWGWERSIYFVDWVWRLFIHTGHYGSGEGNIVDVSGYGTALKELIVGNPIFSSIVLVSFAALIWGWRRALRRRELFVHELVRVLASLVLCELAQLFMVAKHSAAHHLTPSLGLLGFNLAIIACLLQNRWQRVSFSGVISAGRVIIAVVVVAFVQVGPLIKLHDDKKDNVSTISEVLRELDRRYSHAMKICYYRSSSVEYALSFGNDFACSRFTKPLQELYPRFASYNVWDGKYYRFGQEVNVRDLAPLAHEIVLQGTEIPPPYGPVGQFIRIFPGKPESLYRLDYPQSK